MLTETSTKIALPREARPTAAPRNAFLQWMEKPLLIGTDVLVAALCFGITHEPAQVATDPAMQLTAAAFAAVVLFVVLRFWALGHYSRRKPFWDEQWEAFNTVSAALLGNCAIILLADLSFSRLGLLGSWALFALGLMLFRVVVRKALAQGGGWFRQTVIVGSGDNARHAACALESESLMGCQVVAFLEPDAASASGSIAVGKKDIPVLPIDGSLERQLEELGRPHIVLALEDLATPQARDLIEVLSRDHRGIYLVPPLRGLPLYGTDIYHFFSHEVLLLQARNNLARRAPQIIKRIFDIVVASLLLILLSPLLAYLALRIRAGGGSAVYGHTRVGRKGKLFPCYKFRTMVPNAGQVLADLLANDPAALLEWESAFKLRNDPRITPIGAFLRKTSLDELPQLWNVLMGDMSLVGPRPVVEEELTRYGKSTPYYLEARPGTGITGLWQVSGRNEVDYSHRVFLDTWYVKNWSLWYDLIILLKTVKVVLSRHGAY